MKIIAFNEHTEKHYFLFNLLFPGKLLVGTIFALLFCVWQSLKWSLKDDCSVNERMTYESGSFQILMGRLLFGKPSLGGFHQLFTSRWVWDFFLDFLRFLLFYVVESSRTMRFLQRWRTFEIHQMKAYIVVKGMTPHRHLSCLKSSLYLLRQ